MRAARWALLGVVAAAAAVLSFSSLTALAEVCGFARALAWLLPVVLDAGAAAGLLAWLGQGGAQRAPGAGFARALTLALLGSSVAGNAAVHYLQAYRLAPPWWAVVAVSAVAPVVLGAVVHLAVLTSRGPTAAAEGHREDRDRVAPGAGTAGERAVDAEEAFVGGEVGFSEPPPDWWATAPYADSEQGRAAELIDSGAGRRRLARELGVSEHQARQLLAQRNGGAR